MDTSIINRTIVKGTVNGVVASTLFLIVFAYLAQNTDTSLVMSGFLGLTCVAVYLLGGSLRVRLVNWGLEEHNQAFVHIGTPALFGLATTPLTQSGFVMHLIIFGMIYFLGNLINE